MLRAALVLACLSIASSTALGDGLTFDPATVYKVPRGASPADGPADAPVTIVYWSDYACGFCNKVQATLDELDRLYPGQIRWVHRTLPLDEDETTAAEASLAAAAQGAFRPMNDRLYAIQGHVDRAAVELIARELGLDMVRFRADLDTRVHRTQLGADVADGRALGISGTPTFFVNGRPVHGNQNLKVFVDVVDEELARANATKAGYDQLVGQGKPQADATDGERPGFQLDPNSAYRVGLGLPGHQLGPDTAPVTIVEWSDFQCPFCAKSVPVIAKLHEKYGDQLRIIYRHLPMKFHRYAGLAAEAGVAAAAQGKFWPFADQIWSHFGSLTRADLDGFAQAAGLDLPAFRAALDSRRYRDLVVAEAADALALGVDGTPTMFINGYPVVGARDFDSMDKIVAAHLDRVQKAIAAGVPAGDIYALLMSEALGTERSDPSQIPAVSVMKVAMRSEDLSRSVEAACRLRDGKRAAQLAAGLAGDARRHAQGVCSVLGISF